MGQHHWRVPRFFISSAEAPVLGQRVLSVAIVTVGTGPAVECDYLLSDLLRLLFLLVVLVPVLVVVSLLLPLRGGCLLLFLFVCVVELLDPLLDAAQVERLVALLAVPDSTSLVDGVVANDTLYCAFGQLLY